MGSTLFIILGIFVVAAALVYGIRNSGKTKNKPQNPSDQEAASSYSSPAYDEEHERLLSRCRTANDEFARLQNSYISYSQWHSYRDSHAQLNQAVSKLRGARAASPEIRKFTGIYSQLPLAVRKSNADFVLRESRDCNAMFSNLEGKALDKQQREAVVTDEDHTLVVAGAGSGKTLTVAAKVKYLCERKKIPPKDILLISYTNKAADEMTGRIRNLGIKLEAKTFHSLGLGIIGDTEGQKPSVFDQQSDFIRNYFSKKMLALKLVPYAPTLGGLRTTISHPVTTSHSNVPDDIRRKMGITPGLIRVSVGLEDMDDIINDFVQAMKVFD